ncbi:MAG TPA: hypothetical protein VII67_04495 [Acidimicrobiales bacterium]
MELVRLVAPLRRRFDVAQLSGVHPLLFHCSDADTVITTASLAGHLIDPIGVWLMISTEYPAQLAARDVATLAHLVPLRHVVVETTASSQDHADVLRSLLTNDEVNFANDVAVLSGAYNRPAPPAPITVWSSEGTSLSSGDVLLTPRRVEATDVGEFTYFE